MDAFQSLVRCARLFLWWWHDISIHYIFDSRRFLAMLGDKSHDIMVEKMCHRFDFCGRLAFRRFYYKDIYDNVISSDLQWRSGRKQWKHFPLFLVLHLSIEFFGEIASKSLLINARLPFSSLFFFIAVLLTWYYRCAISCHISLLSLMTTWCITILVVSSDHTLNLKLALLQRLDISKYNAYCLKNHSN